MAKVENIEEILANSARERARESTSSQEQLNTKLLLAAQHDHLDHLNQLLKLGANPNATYNNGDTPLLLTTSRECVAALLRAEADPLKGNKAGITPLARHIERRAYKNITLLEEAIALRMRAMPSQNDISGETPAPLPPETGLPSLVRKLFDGLNQG